MARDGLKIPQEQKRARYVTASSGVRRPSFTQSIIFFPMLLEIMPWPHMVVSASIWVFGSFSSFAFKSQGVANAMRLDSSEPAALSRAFDRGGDIDAQAEISFLHGLQKIFRCLQVVEYGRDRGGFVYSVDHRAETRLHIPMPMRKRLSRFARAGELRHARDRRCSRA